MAGGERGEDQLKAVSFAAGTAACMACIERAVMVSVFVHWRVWAFLALNLLLLAILFTSKSRLPSNEIDGEDGANDSELKRKKRRQECSQLVSTNGGGEMPKLPECGDGVEHEMKKAGDYGKKEDYDQLSKEELNQRVEAFIAMFRQHLVSDAKGKSYGLQVSMASNQVNSPQCLSF
ncbi:hypothetical protein Pfo_009027 [Paulownia fortunei]|nr:hypothetical protein Pfo_009027 [Paulownia fortunei]